MTSMQPSRDDREPREEVTEKHERHAYQYLLGTALLRREEAEREQESKHNRDSCHQHEQRGGKRCHLFALVDERLPGHRKPKVAHFRIECRPVYVDSRYREHAVAVISNPSLASSHVRIVTGPQGARGTNERSCPCGQTAGPAVERSSSAAALRARRAGAAREVVVGEPFAEANRLQPGDELGAVINGAWQTLRIVGVGLSPEFVYFVRAGELLPDDRRSGVLWMPRSALAAALDMDGAFNDAALRLSAGAWTPEVLRRADAALDAYGGLGAYDRSEHVSDRYLRDEFDQLGIMGTVPPAIFLGVGAFLVHAVLGRLVRTQREQIATLKAFGYSNASLARHVALMALAVAAAGSLVGVAAGWTLGRDLSRLYAGVFRFPFLEFRLDPRAVALGVAVTAAAAALGALGALRWVVRLAPADAMRPEAPPAFRPTIAERLGVRGLAVRWRVTLRALESHPWRSLLGALGIGMSAAVLVVSTFSLDAVEFMIEREYGAAQRYDASVAFNEPISEHGAGSVRGMLAGTAALRVEPFRAAGAHVAFEHRSRRVAIVALAPDAELVRLLDARGRPVDVPPEGLLLSESLAGAIGARAGDLVGVRFLEGRRREAWIPVAGLFSGLVGQTAYMHRDALGRATGDPRAISGMHVREDRATAGEFFDRLKRTPAVASVTSKRGVIEAFRATIAENITRITLLHIGFAAVIAAGVVYNTGRIAFAERQRELATLRVLGFGRAEVSRMLIAEIMLLAAAGIPVGLLIGRVLAWWLVRSLQTESYTFPLVIEPRTYAFAAAVTAGAVVVSALTVRRGVSRLDLLATLKDAG